MRSGIADYYVDDDDDDTNYTTQIGFGVVRSNKYNKIIIITHCYYEYADRHDQRAREMTALLMDPRAGQG